MPPYRLAVQAEAVLGEDPKLAELFSRVSLKIDIRTEPPGASVYMKEYATPDADWTDLGVTPLEKVRVPVGIFRWKFQRTGYELSSTPKAAGSLSWRRSAISAEAVPSASGVSRTSPRTGPTTCRGTSESGAGTRLRRGEWSGAAPGKTTRANSTSGDRRPPWTGLTGTGSGSHSIPAVKRSEYIRETLAPLDKYLGPVR